MKEKKHLLHFSFHSESKWPPEKIIPSYTYTYTYTHTYTYTYIYIYTFTYTYKYTYVFFDHPSSRLLLCLFFICFCYLFFCLHRDCLQLVKKVNRVLDYV
uniref:Uncharacterized protein n=1 Tax=Palpitomonas bilix TaxID=652834 RepID=A0A7S3DHV7_9EUKA